jgi:hypothetical protein
MADLHVVRDRYSYGYCRGCRRGIIGVYAISNNYGVIVANLCLTCILYDPEINVSWEFKELSFEEKVNWMAEGF